MSYVYLPVEKLDKKPSAKGEMPIKGYMEGHLFAYKPNKDIIMQKYFCECEECLCLNLLFCINVAMDPWY